MEHFQVAEDEFWSPESIDIDRSTFPQIWVKEAGPKSDYGPSRLPAYDFNQNVESTKAIFGIDYADVDIVVFNHMNGNKRKND